MKSRCLIFILLCCLFLSSCSFVSGYGEPEDRYIVSAIGFDKSGDLVEVSVQIIDGGEMLIRRGVGETARQAMAHVEGADEKQLEISHLALVVIGDRISGDSLADIFDFCRKNSDITVGVKVVSAYSASELLSIEGAEGYRLVGAVRDDDSGVGFTAKSRFYEIEDIREASGAYHLPYFETDGEIYTVSGLKIYQNDEGKVRLDRSESAYYMMLKGELYGGSVDVEMDEGRDSVYLRRSKTDYEIKEDALYIKCNLEVNERLLPYDTWQLESALSGEAEKLYGELYTRYGDIFGFGKSEIEVECRIGG